MIKKRIDEEKKRNNNCFPEETAKKNFHSLISETMIEGYKTAVVEKSGSGVMVMIKDFNYDDLRVVFDVLGNVVGGLTPTLNYLLENIRLDVEHIITEPDTVEAQEKFDTNKMIDELLILKAKYEDLIRKSFSINSVVDINFQKGVKKTFETTINKNDRISEYFAYFLNHNFTKLSITNGKEDEFCSQCVNLAKYIIQKDRFEKIYRTLLGQRLLKGLEITEIESLFFIKLKNEFGREMLGRIEGMIKDIRGAKDLNENWKIYTAKAKFENNLNFNIYVLGFVNWPTFQSSVMVLGDEMNDVSKKI